MKCHNCEKEVCVSYATGVAKGHENYPFIYRCHPCQIKLEEVHKLLSKPDDSPEYYCEPRG